MRLTLTQIEADLTIKKRTFAGILGMLNSQSCVKV